MLKRQHYRKLLTAATVGLGLVILLVLTGCGGGQAPDENASQMMQPLPNDGSMTVAGPNGALPCGIADVGADWGHHIFDVTRFPGCTASMPNLTVYCLDGTGHWTDATVAGVSASAADNTVAFEVSQHGTCGLFPSQ